MIEFKNDLLNNIDSIIKIIIDFLNEKVIDLKNFIVPFIKKIFAAMFSNLEFIKNFDLQSLKDYFIEDKNAILNKITETYEGIRDNENNQAFIENVKYSVGKIKEETGKVIKEILNSETAQNIKSKCKEAANYSRAE